MVANHTLVTILLAAITFSGCNSVPSQVHEVIFEKSNFSAPIGIQPGQDDGEAAVERAKRQRIIVSFVPPIILTQYNYFDKKLLSFLVQNGYSRVECLSIENRSAIGASQTRDYCYVVHTASIAELSHIAKRKLGSITYSNKYNTSILGTPLTVDALTFKYRIEITNKHFNGLEQTFDGAGKAVLNPDTGNWQLEGLSLSDKGSAIFSDYIYSHYQPYDRKLDASAAHDRTIAHEEKPAPQEQIILNKLAIERESIRGAWAQVEVPLSERLDIIAKLLEAVKGFAQKDESAIYPVARARAGVMGTKSPKDKIEANIRLDSTLNRLLVIAENYPNIKTDENFLRLRDELAGVENRLAMERRKYNEAVLKYNFDIDLLHKNKITSVFRHEDAYFPAK